MFPRVIRNDDGREPVGDGTYRKALHRWLKRCDVRDEHGAPVHVVPHSFRHTLGIRLKVSGIASVASFAGAGDRWCA